MWWQEIVEYWTATLTPAQSASTLVVHLGLVFGSAAGGWFLRGQIKGRRK